MFKFNRNQTTRKNDKDISFTLREKLVIYKLRLLFKSVLQSSRQNLKGIKGS